MTKANSGKNHPDSWNPLLCWHLLRRSKLYRDTVDTFQEQIEAVPEVGAHQPIKSLFEWSSEEDQTNETDDDRLNYFREPVKEWYEVPIGGHDERQETDALMAFLETYGDVLAFPIHYNTKRPKKEVLDRLWSFRPAVLVSSYLRPMDQNEIEMTTQTPEKFRVYSTWRDPTRTQFPLEQRPQTLYFTIEVNSSFSDLMIKERVDQILSSQLFWVRPDSAPSIEAKAIKVRWDYLAEGVRALDILDSNPKWGMLKLGNELFKGRKMSSICRKDNARARKDTAQNLIEFFNQSRSDRTYEGKRRLKK